VVNRGIAPNHLIDAVNRAGLDIGSWTRSSWSSAVGALSASWARSSWSCSTCEVAGAAIDPQRSSWSRSSWSSAGEDASAEAAMYAPAADEAADTGTLDAPIPTDEVETVPAPETETVL
jgi:serine protease AprX